MGKIRYLIEIYKKLQGEFSGSYTYSTTPFTITDGLAFDSDKSIEASSDSFSFRVRNAKDANGDYLYRDKIKVDDRVIIYLTTQADITDANKSSYRKTDGIITETKYETSIDGSTILLKGESRLNRMLNFTHPAVYEPQAGFTSYASNIIQALIDVVNDSNANYQITWHPDNDSTSTEIQYYRNYRPIMEMISELSKQKINREFNAYFYLDTQNRFVWIQKSKDTDTVSLVEGTDFIKITNNDKVWEVINAMVVDCGKDPAGNNIHTQLYDEESAAKYGLKWASTIEPQTEIASTLISNQKALSDWTDNSDENKQNFPASSSYPLTLSFEGRDTNGALTGSKVVVTSDATWIAAIRTEAKQQGKEWIQNVLEFTGHVRPKIDITMIGGDWEMGSGRTGLSSENCLNSNGVSIYQGDFVNIISKSRGGIFETGQEMRVVQVNHELSTKGWEVTMRLEMDVDDAASFDASGHS